MERDTGRISDGDGAKEHASSWGCQGWTTLSLQLLLLAVAVGGCHSAEHQNKDQGDSLSCALTVLTGAQAEWRGMK